MHRRPPSIPQHLKCKCLNHSHLIMLGLQGQTMEGLSLKTGHILHQELQRSRCSSLTSRICRTITSHRNSRTTTTNLSSIKVAIMVKGTMAIRDIITITVKINIHRAVCRFLAVSSQIRCRNNSSRCKIPSNQVHLILMDRASTHRGCKTRGPCLCQCQIVPLKQAMLHRAHNFNLANSQSKVNSHQHKVSQVIRHLLAAAIPSKTSPVKARLSSQIKSELVKALN